MEAENGESFSSSEQHSEGIYSRDQSFDKGQIQYSQSVPMSGKIMVGPSLSLLDKLTLAHTCMQKH